MEPIEVSDTIEETLCRQATAQRIPINGILELTSLCNMDCRMCYVRLSRQEMEARGRLRTAEEWLALGRQMRQAGTLFLLLTGGEPLMYPQFKEVYLGLKKLGMVMTINTNGTLIDEEWAAFFGAHKPRRINITLYGADDEAYEKLCRRPGGFSETIQAIRLLRSKGVDVKLNGSITPINQNDAERIIQIARSLDIPYKLDTYMYPATRERGRAYDETARLTPEAAAAVRVRLMRAGSTEAQFRDMAHKALSAVLKDGDRALLQCVNGVWTAGGWPVCGTSGVCRNEDTPIGAIVVLSQAPTDQARPFSPAQAFSQLFSQITVNRWNRPAALRAMELLEQLVAAVPVFHLACTMNETAVQALEEILP